MGDHKVSTGSGGRELRQFTKSVLSDLQALEKMFERNMFEDDKLRIGAEQEMFLVDSAMCPSPIATKIIEDAGDERLTTEIGLFNIETNSDPLDFTGDALRKMDDELREIIGIVKKTAKNYRSDVVLVGILPTIQQSDLVMENLTPLPRYKELNRILTELQGDDRIVHIKGLDELALHLDDTFMEFCNTSFQVHLQIPISEFVNYYNWSQAIAAPAMASAVNSPLLLGHRLWSETRLALFKHAVDTRSPALQARSQPTRVNFGDRWLEDSVLKMFHEDVARFRILLTRELEEDSLETLRDGGVPKLKAWQMHNGTIWRWNRACYGVMNGKPSFRIEARYLPSGPTVLDEMANSAFLLGLMMALPKEYGEVSERMLFETAKDNFFSVARFGMKSQITWLDGHGYRPKRLILDELLPRAESGLRGVGIVEDDIKRYLSVISERVEMQRTGAAWMLESLSKMDESTKSLVRMRELTSQMIENQETEKPVHEWELAEIDVEETDWIDNYQTVERFMSKDLFTVRPGDIVDLAASLMNWKHIRHVPVEDDDGSLVGVVSHRDLLEILAKDMSREGEIVVRDIMETELVTIAPETKTLEALNLMREKNIGCLPVVKEEKLIGIITAHDFLSVSAMLFEDTLQEID